MPELLLLHLSRPNNAVGNIGEAADVGLHAEHIVGMIEENVGCIVMQAAHDLVISRLALRLITFRLAPPLTARPPVGSNTQRYYSFHP